MAENKKNIQDKYNFNNPDNNNGSGSSPVSYVLFAVLVVLGVGYLIYGGKSEDSINANQKTIEVDKKQQLKKITFKTSNLPVENIEIVIKDGNNKTLEILSTNSKGEAQFNLKEKVSIKLRFLSDKYYIKSDRPMDMAYENIMFDDVINMHVHLKEAMFFEINPMDLNTNSILHDAKISSSQIQFDAVKKSDGGFQITIPKENLWDRNYKINDKIDFTIDCPDYSTQSLEVVVKEKYKKNHIVKLLKGMSQKFVFLNSQTKDPVSSINVYADDAFLGKTNGEGAIFYKYDGNSVGSTMNLAINVPKYLKFSQSYRIAADANDKTYYIDPIYLQFNIADYSTSQPIDDLLISIKDVFVGKHVDGVYEVPFNSINKNYSLLVTDPNNKYEDTILDVAISENNNGSVLNQFLYQKTSVLFHVVGEDNESLEKVNFIIDGNPLTETTNNQGELLYKMKYSNAPLNVELSKNGFINYSESLTLQPGQNSKQYMISPLIQYVEATNFNTKQAVEGLKFECEKNCLIDAKLDLNKQQYKLHFSKSGDYKINIIDSKNQFQTTSFKINVSKDNRLAVKSIDMYEVTFVDFKFNNRNGNALPGVNVDINNQNIGATNTSGTLRELFEYKNSKIDVSIKLDYYYDVDTTLSIVPGDDINNYFITLKELPPVIINVLNEETKQNISNVLVSVNGQEYEADAMGDISLNPLKVNQNFDLSFSDNNVNYYDHKSSFNYDPSNYNINFELKPVAYLYVNTFYGDGSTPMPSVQLKLNNQNIATTDNAGFAKIKIDKYGKYTLYIEKEMFEPVQLEWDIQTSKTEASAALNKLNQTVKLKNIFGSPITDALVSCYDRNSAVDEYGNAKIKPKYLNEPVQVKFSSKKAIYRDTVIVFNFKKNNEIHDVMLFTNPLTLNVTVEDAEFGIPGIGTIDINPPPNKSSTFNIDNGKAEIKVYESGAYDIVVNALINDIAVQHNETITLNLEEKVKNWGFYLKNAILTVLTNGGVPVIVEYAENEDFIKELKGDGLSQLELPNYGEYKFTFQPEGFTQPITEIRNINRAKNNLDFRMDDNYTNCNEAFNNGQYQAAIENCNKVPKGNKNYCDAKIKVADIYKNHLNDETLNAVKTWDVVLEGSREGVCEENPSYYNLHAFLMSNITQIDEKLLNDIWRPNSGKMDLSFNKYISLCPLTGQNCGEDEKSLRMQILSSICYLMDETFIQYDNIAGDAFAIDQANQIKQINDLLYSRYMKYSAGLTGEEKNEYQECFENKKID
ncbi:MAG: hypothetical protein CMG09_05795 [Candidatus Marinimicrobia bacterium]|nr:hypothetical protein [Candidatus Neomarinimicrobiota bacterium]|tara:strand:+ start:3917 stop:7693 length:3777 start_codon:yes stop_codon:yes gene_type:complete